MSNLSAIHGSTGRSYDAAGGVNGFVARLMEVALVWQSRADQRAKLATMDEYMLKDIGLTRADVERERTKPFWRA